MYLLTPCKPVDPSMTMRTLRSLAEELEQSVRHCGQCLEKRG